MEMSGSGAEVTETILESLELIGGLQSSVGLMPVFGISNAVL